MANKIRTKKCWLTWQLEGNLGKNTFTDKGKSPDYTTNISFNIIYAFYKKLQQGLKEKKSWGRHSKPIIGEREMAANGYWVSFRRAENVLKTGL